MSEASVALNARSFILEHAFEGGTARDLGAVLEAARPGPLQFFWEAGEDASLSREAIRERATGLYLLFACANLTDDLVDDECTYLEEPHRRGPIVQFILRSLATEQLCGRAALAGPALTRASLLLAQATSFALVELDTQAWDGDQWMTVGRSIAGQQYQAYLNLLWADTTLAPLADEVGMALGMMAHLYHDVRSHDPRLFSMSPSHRERIIALVEQGGRELGEMAERHGLKSVLITLPHLNWRTIDGANGAL